MKLSYIHAHKALHISHNMIHYYNKYAYVDMNVWVVILHHNIANDLSRFKINLFPISDFLQDRELLPEY